MIFLGGSELRIRGTVAGLFLIGWRFTRLKNFLIHLVTSGIMEASCPQANKMIHPAHLGSRQIQGHSIPETARGDQVHAFRSALSFLKNVSIVSIVCLFKVALPTILPDDIEISILGGAAKPGQPQPF